MKNKIQSQKLNLGCGNDIRRGYLNLDFESFSGVDMVHDLNKFPYPFPDNSFKEIIMQNILEHLSNPYKVMLEIHRISSPGARVFIRTPHFSSNNAWGDLQHTRGFNTDTFINQNMKDLFEVVSQEITFAHIKFFVRFLAKINPKFYEKHLAYIFTAVDLIVELKVKK
ncbi:MAG: methyltransferase domain-containing protein [Nanoarchaeota archaeon]|nr:methyltransferase domain-containing protein [Nanoarchaeota archaeon]